MAYYCKYYNSPSAIALSKKLAKSHDTWIPEVDIFETESEVIAIIDLPGVDASDIELSLEEEKITIKGVRKLERPQLISSYRQLEINHGQFERTLDLPCAVELGKAHICNGVLEITLPKSKPRSDKPIAIHID